MRLRCLLERVAVAVVTPAIVAGSRAFEVVFDRLVATPVHDEAVIA